jgi:ubiquitin carboxyl-terminal hydrolase 9/24
MPASGTLGEDASDFQYNFLKSGGLPLVLSMLTRNNFLPSADMETRRGAYLNALKIAKLLLTAVGFGHVKAVAEACQPVVEGTSPASPVNNSIVLLLNYLCKYGENLVVLQLRRVQNNESNRTLVTRPRMDRP